MLDLNLNAVSSESAQQNNNNEEENYYVTDKQVDTLVMMVEKFPEGENYHIWAINMKTFLRAQNMCEVVENDVDPSPQSIENPTVAQIKKHEEDKARKAKALTYLHSALVDSIFARIMTCETPKDVWDKLKAEFEGSERVKSVKLLTLKREF